MNSIRHSVTLFLRKMANDGILERASSLAFQVIFSFIPMIALAYALFAWLGGFEKLRVELSAWLLQYIAPSLTHQVESYLASIENRVSPEALGIFGVVGFLYIVFRLIGQAESTLNSIWGITESRPLRDKVLLYVVALIVTPLALGGSLVLTSFFASLLTTQLDLIFEPDSYASRMVILGLALVPMLMTGAFLAIAYSALPFTPVSRRAALISGFATGLVLEILKNAYAFYASYALRTSIYGALAALPILFIWIYMGCAVFLLGAELCYFLDQRRSGVLHVAPSEAQLSVAMLMDILREYDSRRSETDERSTREPLAVPEIVARLKWDPSVVHQHILFLKKKGFLKPARHRLLGEECYYPRFDELGDAQRRVYEIMSEYKYENWSHSSALLR